MKPTERQIQKSIKDYLNSQPKTRIFEIRNGATFDPIRKIYRSNSSEKGISDLFGSYQGRAIAIECKRHDGKITKEQIQFLEHIRHTGGIAGVCRSLDDAIKLIAKAVMRPETQEKTQPLP